MANREIRKICITFAGVVGSSKTPIAMYLSGKLDLALHNNDAIRTEVTEDRGSCLKDEYLKRRDARVVVSSFYKILSFPRRLCRGVPIVGKFENLGFHVKLNA